MGTRRDAKKQIRVEQEVARQKAKADAQAAVGRQKAEAREAKRAAARAAWAAKTPEQKKQAYIVGGIVLAVVVGGIVLISALGGNDDSAKIDTTSGSETAATSGSETAATDEPKLSGDAKTAKFYKDRACEDLRELLAGITDRTMSGADAVDKLGKMAKNTKDAALFDPSLVTWDTAVRRLKVDLEDGAPDATIQADASEAGSFCT